ncbi:MAG: DUF1016 family protein [Desulfobacteraceae bacterium]|nr:DUF1016 family protein [Desulfobacteraceae bacterium]
MIKCEACETTNSIDAVICDKCGYDFEKKVITDVDKLRTFFHEVKGSREWIPLVTLEWKVHNIQFEALKTGYPWEYRVDGKWEKIFGKWNNKKTATLFGEGKNEISINLRLAEALHKYPQWPWEDCQNMKQARELYKEFELLGTDFYKAGTYFKYEKDLQKYLENNWDNIHIFEEWDLIKCSQKIKTNWEIDLIARHKRKNRWLVVELKKGVVDDKTIVQISRYIEYVKKNYVDEGSEVEGLIIGLVGNDKLEYALKRFQDISFKAYYFENGELEFLDPPLALRPLFVKNLRMLGSDGLVNLWTMRNKDTSE